MDPLADTTEPVTIGLVGAPVDAFPGLRALGAELEIDVRAGEDEPLEAIDPSLVVCDGRGGLVSLAGRPPQVPILPVDPTRRPADSTTGFTAEWDDAAVPGVSRDATADAVRSLWDDGGETRSLPTLSVEAGSASADAVFDVALVTEEPGTIAAFAVRSNDEPVADVRADGLVVATPAGSHGYARAVGGPVLAPGSSVVAVVAISPFAIRHSSWVGPPDGLGLSIDADGPAAEVQCDGHVRHTVPAGSTLRLETGPPLSIVTPHALSE